MASVRRLRRRTRSAAARLGGPAAVVRLGGDVLDRADLEAGRLERADRGLTARAGALDEDVDLLHAVLLRTARGGLGGELGSEGRRLARALEADLARRGPRDHSAGGVGDRDDRVVERALDVRVTVRDVLLLLASRLADAGAGLGRHVLVLSRFEVCWSLGRAALLSASPSSCPRRCAWAPCGYARWSSCAGRAPGGRGGDGCPGRSRSRPCGGCPRRPRGAGHPRA